MQKIVMFCKRSLICFILSFSLLCNNTAAVSYQAAAIPVVYSAWEVFVTIFTLLGITISCIDTVEARSSAAEELEDKFVGWKVLKNEGKGDNDGDGEDDLYAAFDILEYVQGDKLVIPEEDLEDFKEFYQDNMAPPVAVKPIDNTDIKKMNFQEFTDWFTSYFADYSSLSGFKSFYTKMYDLLCTYSYSGVVFFDSMHNNYFFDTLNYSSTLSGSWGKQELSNGGSFAFGRIASTSTCIPFGERSYIRFGKSGYSNFWENGKANTSVASGSGDTILAFIVNGRLYDPAIFTDPINSTTAYDRGAVYSAKDFVKSVNNLGNSFTDEPSSVGGLDLTDKIQNGTYDVVGGGHEYDSNKKDTVGGITVPMPSGDVITDYQNGVITYEQFLDELGVVPIDKASGTNLLTQEFLDTQTGIFDGVKSLVDLVRNIWNFLANFIQNLINALLNMFTGLFIPADGYFENYFTRINDFFDSRLGFLYTPFDLLIRFLSALPSADHSSTQLYFPGLKFQEYVLCEPMYVELNLRDEFPSLYRYMYFITDTILIGAVLWLLQSKTKELIKG